MGLRVVNASTVFIVRALTAAVLGASCLVLVLVMTPSAVAASNPCLRMGRPVSINGVTTAVCAKLYTSGAAIRLPKDTGNARYGVLDTFFDVSFIDRANNKLAVPASRKPQEPNVGVGGQRSFSQVVYKATLTLGEITKLTPVLFIPVSTPVLAYRNKTFIGQVTNMVPSDGVPETDFVRMDFATSFTAEGALKGSFSNLRRSVRRTQVLEPLAPCEPALLGLDTPRNDWYLATLGRKASITLVWDPAMHAPLNSVLVIYVGSGRGHMGNSPSLLELMKGHINTAAENRFNLHGNPLGMPAIFEGAFQTRSPVRTCNWGA